VTARRDQVVAAVIDGRLTTATLIEDCEQIAKHHTDIPARAKEILLAALRACREANRERNRVVHDTWATRPGNVMVTLHGGRKSHDVTVTAGAQGVLALRARTSRYCGLPSPRRPRAVNGTVVTANPDAVRSLRTAGSGQVR